MKIVIADDEWLARFTLKNMLDDMDLPLQIVGEAANGEELITLIKRHKPDIAFVDIRMPAVNGLDAIKQVQSLSEHTNWIILTGFSEFEYAKESITLGVSGYLLKPPSVDELKSALIPILQKNRKYKIACSKEFENELVALTHDISILSADDKGNFLNNAAFVGSIFVFDSYMDELLIAQCQQQFCQEVRKVIEEMVTVEFRAALFVLPGGKLSLITGWPKHQDHQLATKFLTRVEKIAKDFNTDAFAVTEFRTDQAGDFTSMNKCFNQILNLEPFRAVKDLGCKIAFGKLLETYSNSPRNVINTCGILERISDAYHAKDYANFVNKIDELEKAFFSFEKTELKNNKEGIYNFISHSYCNGIGRSQEPAEWIKASRKIAERMLTDRTTDVKLNVGIVNTVKSLIEQHFFEDISISQIAGDLNLTANYLSTLFHKDIGMTFVKYLTKFRMLKARELLAGSQLQINQVAERVGYTSPRHFSKLFKEYYGVYPSELQKTIGKYNN